MRQICKNHHVSQFALKIEIWSLPHLPIGYSYRNALMLAQKTRYLFCNPYNGSHICFLVSLMTSYAGNSLRRTNRIKMVFVVKLGEIAYFWSFFLEIQAKIYLWKTLISSESEIFRLHFQKLKLIGIGMKFYGFAIWNLSNFGRFIV